jgi:hypothetical protein
MNKSAEPGPTCLYSPDCPEGRVFFTGEAIAAAEKDGWVDTPAKLPEAKPPGKRGAGGKRAASDDHSQ